MLEDKDDSYGKPLVDVKFEGTSATITASWVVDLRRVSHGKNSVRLGASNHGHPIPGLGILSVPPPYLGRGSLKSGTHPAAARLLAGLDKANGERAKVEEARATTTDADVEAALAGLSWGDDE